MSQMDSEPQLSTSSEAKEDAKPFVAKKATYETEVQWQYRKKFLDHYEGKYPIERLESWSKILSNSKFYGCTYNQDVMQKLNCMLAEMGEETIQPRI
ncbi:hypothetical protein BV898_16461 [Hypsibius exemplaris]|uniref:XRN2-binding (XTBD) domain-containing protein n=1 Tax=Hypsibius exemplaris TaxID=2072580 RepID=A0A9X6ND90_HYPEX|nr:hypothetical protein BV898_16461 [Hypsibius exemplaris]